MRAHGFTLIELMVTIAVVAILAAIAFPSFKSTLQSNNVSTTANELLASFSLARSEAIRSNKGAGICPSANGTNCSGAGGSWNDGWLVRIDQNGNGILDETGPVVRYSQARTKTTLAGVATEIVFDSRGRPTVNAARAIGLRPADGTTPVRCFTMNVTGQISVLKTSCP